MNTRILIAAAIPLFVCSCATKDGAEKEINDSTTPLHLLKPDYVTPYGKLTQEDVKATVDRIFKYIDEATPAVVENPDGSIENSTDNLTDEAMLHQGTFRLTSYEWAVTYMALLKAAEIMESPEYKNYVTDRVGFLAHWAQAFREQALRTGEPDRQMRQVALPATLDDAGAMSCAFMQVAEADSTLGLGDCIERYYAIVDSGTHRLADGTIARNRPHYNSVWLDDMFMALPAMAQRSIYTGDNRHLDAAADMAAAFISRMWMPDKKLFRHGYVEGHDVQPAMAWGRANGWAILTLTMLLDKMPVDHPRRALLMNTLKEHIAGLTERQGKNGYWHQLLDREDTYEETSATAIFTYCIAHAINEGWIDPVIYGPVAHLGWEAVSDKVNSTGEVEGVCVGTGMAFDPAFYSYRPVSTKAAHGYGPAIMAGAEMVRLLNNFYPTVNDAAVHYYSTDPEPTVPIFSLDSLGKASEILH